MSFSDDDLNKLKVWWKQEFDNGWSCGECGINQVFDIPALLARLECAEAYAKRFDPIDGFDYEAYDAWLKSKGSSPKEGR